MKHNWNYQDSIDLDYFQRQDTALPAAALHERDRRLFLELVEPRLNRAAEAPPSLLLKLWLEARRSEEPDETGLPGRLAAESLDLMRIVLAAVGLVLGVSAASLYFSYSGTTPVNVLHFMVLFVFSQLLLVTLVVLRTAILRLFRIPLPRTLLVRFFALLSMRISHFFSRESEKRLAADRRQAMQATLGRIRGFSSVHGRLVFWPLFLLVQVTGICFNLGLLGTSLLRLTISDIAFGWQSTLQFSAASLHSAVHWLSLPWSWLLPEGIGYPTLAQVEGSRIILKEGIAHLATANLVSWWPFLLMSVVVYGLSARVLLYSYGYWQQKKAEGAAGALPPASRQILQRMQTPLLSTQAEEPDKPAPSEQTQQPKHGPAPETAADALQSVHLLLPDEIYDQCLQQPLAAILARDGYHIGSCHRFLIDYEADQLLLSELGTIDWQQSGGIIIVMEAWMPPLVDFLTFLKELRQQVGARLPIFLRLVGRPAAESILTSVDGAHQHEVWQRKIDSLADPYIQVTDLVREETA